MNETEYCRRGHEYTPENTSYIVDRGKRYRRCLACNRIRNRRHKQQYRQRVRERMNNAITFTMRLPDGSTSLGRILRYLRLRSGKTLMDVCERAGVSTAVLSRVERDQRDLPVEALRKISALFGVRASHILHTLENVKADNTHS